MGNRKGKAVKAKPLTFLEARATIFLEARAIIKRKEVVPNHIPILENQRATATKNLKAVPASTTPDPVTVIKKAMGHMEAMADTANVRSAICYASRTN